MIDSLVEIFSRDNLYEITKPVIRTVIRKDSKEEIVNKIKNYIEQSPKHLEQISEQLALHLPYGKNKQIYFKKLNLQSRIVLQKISEGRLNEIHSYCNIDLSSATQSFNDLLNSNPQDDQVLYFRIDKDSSDNTSQIELCIFKTIEPKSSDAIEVEDYLYNYIWVKFYIEDAYLTIHVNPQDTLMINQYTTRSLFKDVLIELEQIFQIALNEDMLFAREKLFLIYSEYIKKFEEPYKSKVEDIDNLIRDNLLPVASALDLDVLTSEQLLSRHKTLLERFLIINNMATIEEHEREGIINKFAVSDNSGGKATLFNTDANQGIDVANLYLDIRDTLDEVKQLDKLWVDWIHTISEEQDRDTQLALDLGLNQNSNQQHEKTKYKKIKTFLDVSQDALVISFMRGHYAEKGDVDYVLGKITKFIQS